MHPSDPPTSAPPASPVSPVPAGSSAGGAPAVERLTRALSRLRTRARLLLLARGVGLIVGGILVVAIVLGLIDFAVRMPMGVRVSGWVVWVALVVVAIWKLIVPAARFRPRLTDMALRVERARPEVRGLLASAIDFAEHGDVSQGPDRTALSRALERMVVSTAEREWRDALASHLLRPAPALRAGAFMVLMVVLALAPLAVSSSLWKIGVTRVFAPWSDASWPKRTGVADVTGARVHPLGTALTLRAGLTKSGRAPENSDVFLRYRLVTEGRASASRRELLTLQPQAFSMETPKGVREVPLFERRVEPVADAIEYRFETEDDETEWARIELVEPPGVSFAEATIVPPSYVGGESAPVVRVDLGPGTDERAMAPTTLVGSRVELDLRLNKPARFVGADGEAASGFGALVDPEAAGVEDVEFEGGRLRATLTLRETLRLPITLVDEHGIRSMDEVVYIFGATQDAPAGATITEPGSDLTVLPTALVEVRAEGRDDVGLDWVSVERSVYVPAGRPGSEPSGPGGATEPEGDAVEIARASIGGDRLSATVEVALDLAELGVRAGDEVHLVAIASDLFAAGGAARGPTRSGARVLQIIDEDRFIEEVQAQLSDVRQSAIRIEAQQGEVQGATRESGASGANRRGQSQVSERISRQVEAIDRLSKRIDQNRLDDEGLREMLGETRDTLNRAGTSASQASSAMDQAASEQDAEDGRAEVGPEVEQDQQRVRDELAQLIRMLDVGKDNWVVEKTLASIIDQQKGLQADAAQMAAMTAGREVSELSEGERQRLDQIEREQDDLAQKLDDLLQEMREREAALRENDPLAAMGMQAAAQRAQRDQTSESMREAAESAGENQMANAGEQQQEALESLEEMMEDLKAGDRKKDEVLRRLLLSIIESIEALILQQQGELDAFDDALGAGRDLASLDGGMIALHQNTLGVVGLAREGGAELAQVADLVARAGDLQQRAIMGLRSAEIDADGVRALEVQSLDTLEEARRLAKASEERLEQQELEQRKRELRQAYREALEKQVALRSDIEPFTQLDEVSRRDRVRIRRGAEPQEEIRVQLLEVAKATAEFKEARVYEHAHQRLDRIASDAVGALNEGDPTRAVPRQDAVIAMLTSIIESLKEPEPDKSEFEEAQSGGGGGGGGGAGNQEEQLVTLIGELTLLRSIQQIVADDTAAADQGLIETDEGDLADLADQQNELAGVAEDLVSRLRGGSGTLPPEGFEPPAEGPEQPEGGEGSDPGEGSPDDGAEGGGGAEDAS